MADAPGELGSAAAARPFYEFLGFEVVASGDGRSEVRLPDKHQLHNSRGDTHGGAVAALLDAAIGAACRSLLEKDCGVTTVSLTVNYVAPGRGQLVGRGNIVRAGRSIASGEATIEDETGGLVAHAVAVLRILRPRVGEEGRR